MHIAEQTIDHLLHIGANVYEYNAKNLPLYLKAAYNLSVMHIAGVDCLLAKPIETINLATMRKQRTQLTKYAGIECVLYFEKTSPYIKRKLTEEGIPFIIENKNVYLPFLAMVLSNEKERFVPKVKKISFATQRLLLTALYEHWHDINLTDIARYLDISKMTVSRCFDQAQSLGLPVISELGKERRFIWKKDARAFFELIKNYLQNPVAKTYCLDAAFTSKKVYKFGSMSALSYYGDINDNDYATYALTKAQAKDLDIYNLEQVPDNEQPQAILQVLQYEIPFGKKRAIDPITAYLSLDMDDKQDPRVEQVFNKIMEEMVYGKRN